MSDKVLAEARRLYNLGAAVLWLHPKSKRPVANGWTTGARATWTQLQSTYIKGYNVGVRLGEASQIGKNYLACFDVDIKHPAFEPKARALLLKVLGDIKCPTVLSGAANGSMHLYCVTPKPFKMITLLKEKGQGEICFYSTGRQMVVSPSIHPDTGKTYTWKEPLVKEADLPEVDSDLVSDVAHAASAFSKPPAPSTKCKTLTEIKTTRDSGLEKFEVLPVDLEWVPHISDKMRAMIITGKGVSDRSAMLMPACVALLRAGLTRNEILSVLTNKDYYLGGCAYDHAKTQNQTRAARWLWTYTLKGVTGEHSAKALFSEPVPVAMELNFDEMGEGEDEALNSWVDEMDTTKQGEYRGTLKNIDLVLSKTLDPPIFVKDLFANRVSYGLDTPWGGRKGEYLEDIDLVLVRRWLASHEFGLEAPVNLMHDVTALISHRYRVHPVREYLTGLVWDGVPRIDTWLKDYCNAQAFEPYLSEVSRKFLLAMVKRVFEPGCQWDYVLVLEGKQGTYKSSTARALVGDKWFMDNLPELKDKDAMLNLQGKWLIELGELANIKKTDYNQVKAYLIRRTDTVRAHYGRIHADAPRQSVFIGTVNEGQYLKDPTGNRRFWPVHVGLCDAKRLSQDRDQLFAEAMHVYKTTNEMLMLSGEAANQAAEAQDEKRIDDLNSEMLDAFKEFQESDASKDFDFTKFKMRDLFEMPDAPWSRWKGDHNRFAVQTGAQVLYRLGFYRKLNGPRLWTNDPDKWASKGSIQKTMLRFD